MAFGRKKSTKHERQSSDSFKDYRKSVKVSKSDADKLKVRTINVHDPILNAVNESQPFQDALTMYDPAQNMNTLSMIAQRTQMRDNFGNPIVRPDISNPTRSRDERPMDTIRSFEYAITGDTYYKSSIETPTYGWNVRPSYPLAPQNMNPTYTSNPYNNYTNGSQLNSVPRTAEQAIYQAPPKPVVKKEKRGFFGRKKKNQS